MRKSALPVIVLSEIIAAGFIFRDNRPGCSSWDSPPRIGAADIPKRNDDSTVERLQSTLWDYPPNSNLLSRPTRDIGDRRLQREDNSPPRLDNSPPRRIGLSYSNRNNISLSKGLRRSPPPSRSLADTTNGMPNYKVM